MTTQIPVIKNDAAGAILYTALVSQASPAAFQANPTLAAGDVKISLDGGAFNNLGTLPAVTPAAGKAVKITLSQAETNGDNLVIVFSDAAGAEWCDQVMTIPTAPRHLGDLAFPTTSGRSIDVDANGGVEVGSFQAGAIDAAAIAADAIGASELAADAATEIATAVWAAATRVLTANTNLNDLSAAGVRAAVGLAGANLDTQLAAIAGYIDTEIASIISSLAAVPTANANADALLDRAAGVETGLTVRQFSRLVAAVLLGKASGMATTTATFRDTGDTKDRIVATVDSSGNRTAITRDAT